MKEILQNMINKASSFGVSETDITNSQEFLDNREYGLCFDTLINQIYENEISIDKDFYELLTKAAIKMKIPRNDFDFIKELITE